MDGIGATLDVVSFVAGGFRFAVEANTICSMSSSSAGETMVQAEELIGIPLQPRTRRRWLSTRQGHALEVSEPVELRRLGAAQIFALPEMAATRITLKKVRAIALDKDGIILLLDLERP